MDNYERETIANHFNQILRIVERVPIDEELREGIQETPMRFAKAVEHWTSGYNKNPNDVIKMFTDGAKGCDEMIVVRDIPFYSQCEHHFAPFFGTATIAYIPDGNIVGLSKFSRLLEIFTRRLQVQERITNQIADCFMEDVGALGVGVIIKARHMCCESRGIEKQGSFTVTSALRGVMRDQAETRAEFLMIANTPPPSM